MSAGGGGSAAPPAAPTDASSLCDTMNLEEVMRQASSQYNAGHAKSALAHAFRALSCKQDVRMYRFVVTYACVARDAATAKEYFAKVPLANQTNLEQRCQQEGINLREP